MRVIGNYPEYIQYLENTLTLEQIAKGFLGNIDSLPEFHDKKKQLGNYYDLEFLRVGLETIRGAPIEKINTEDLNQKAPRPMNSSFILDKLVNRIHWEPSDIDSGLAKLKRKYYNSNG